MVRLILALAVFFGADVSLAFAKLPSGGAILETAQPATAAAFGVPAAKRDSFDANPVLLAKKGISLKKLRSMRIPTGDDMRKFWTRLSSGTTITRLMVAGPVLGALLFGAMAAFRFLRFVLRGMFLRNRRGLVVDARLTGRGRYKPVVAFEHQQGQVLRLLAPFDTRHDPRGEEMTVEIWGNSATVVRKRRGFFGGLFSVLFPLVLLIICLALMGPESGLSTG